MIPSVNFHLWQPCNMCCRFCFATFPDVKQFILPAGHLPQKDALEVVNQLADLGFEKITFAGGEPTLCPWLTALIACAKEKGMTTMIVTNGSNLTDEFLMANQGNLNWIALSIDSLNPETNISIGRAIYGKKPLQADYYKELVDKVKKYGYRLKINTVVNSRNHGEDMSEFITYARPERWKVFQVLPIKGENDAHIEELRVTEEQFNAFCTRHADLDGITTMVPETNEQIKGSYAMVDPAGRFYDNAEGCIRYSRPILEIGAQLAIQQVSYDLTKFLQRGGVYNWGEKDALPSRITLSGKVASGKSTIGKRLAEKLGYAFTSIGNETRAMAEEKGMSIVEFQKECTQNPALDIEIDRVFSNNCNEQENLIIDYRLGFKFIKDGYHIYLKISDEKALEHLKKANRSNETHHTLHERNDAFQKQFENAYGVDYTNENFYDLVINTEDFDSIDSIVNYIINTLNITITF